MWSDYNFNSENFENISSQSGFLSLPDIFPCAAGVNKYFHLEHANNCFIFLPYKNFKR